MKVDVLCNGELINKSSNSNPFGSDIPLVGDEVELGLRKFGDRIEGEMIIYKVIKRRFSTVGTYNSCYVGQQCTLFVEKV